jgi:hypothetical protein
MVSNQRDSAVRFFFFYFSTHQTSASTVVERSAEQRAEQGRQATTPAGSGQRHCGCVRVRAIKMWQAPTPCVPPNHRARHHQLRTGRLPLLHFFSFSPQQPSRLRPAPSSIPHSASASICCCLRVAAALFLLAPQRALF